MENLKLTPCIIKLILGLLLILEPSQVLAQQTHYSGYVGEEVHIDAPDMGEYITIEGCYWESSDKSCVAVNGKNHAEGAEAHILKYFSGQVKITCSFSYTWYDRNNRRQMDHSTKSYYISAKAIPLYLSASEISLAPGENYTISYYTTPSVYPGPVVNFTSSDESVATVILQNEEGYIVAKGGGTCIITAEGNTGYKAPTCKVIVEKIDPTSVSIQKTASLIVGNSVTLTPTVTPERATTTYSWKSDNEEVATVSSSGKVTGKAKGSAQITVTTHNGLTSTCNVDVDWQTLTLKADLESGLYAKGTKVSLTANHSDAEIYYTLDGSTPTHSSTRYNNGITLDKSVTLKAIAMGSEYNPSDLVTRTYEVTGLMVENYTPSNGTTTRDFSTPPSVTFNEAISKGSKFSDISFKSDDMDVDGSVSIEGSKLVFTPKATNGLPDGEYTFFIPERALKNGSGESNLTITYVFTIKCPKLVLTVDVESGLVAPGTKVSLKCDVSTAKIYYSTESIFSDVNEGILYMNPISIDKTTRLFAKAVMDGYRSITILREYTVSSLCVTEDNMGDERSIFTPRFIPSITFNSNIKKGEAFKRIAINRGWNTVEGDAVIVGKTLYFVPKKELLVNKLDFIIPQGAVVTEKNEPNFQLSYSFSIAYNNPVKKLSGSHSATVMAGPFYSMYINDYGELWMWGNNKEGQLGDGTTDDREVPWKVMENVKSVATFDRNTGASFDTNSAVFAIKNDNSLWGWGANNNGQLGINSTQGQKKPHKIMDNAATVYTNNLRTFAIKGDGTLYGWGQNSHGEVIAETTTNYTSPQKIMTGVKSLVVRKYMTYAIKSDNSLWVWGQNFYGSLGTGQHLEGGIHLANGSVIGGKWVDNYANKPYNTLNSVKQASASLREGFAIQNNGSLLGWGQNYLGEVGNNKTDNVFSPVAIMSNVKSITANEEDYSVYAIKNDNTLYAWGDNSYGQLGDGTTTERHSPTRIMDNVKEVFHSDDNYLLLKNDNTLWSWGQRNDAYGYNYKDQKDRLSPAKILDDVISCSLSSTHAIAIKDDGSVWIWGNGTSYLGVYSSSLPTMIYGPYSVNTTLTGISLSSEQLTIRVNEQSFIDVNLLPLGATYESIAYESSNTNIATISDRGVITGVKAGTTNVNVTVNGKYKKTCSVTVTDIFNININTVEHGSLRASVQTAKVGETVELTITPDEFYKLEKLNVLDSSNKPIEYSLNDNVASFIMPYSDVTVDATFSLVTFSITIRDTYHGSISSHFDTAKAGETVTLSIEPEDGYILENLSVIDAESNSIECQVNRSTATFVMPASSVMVSATFIEATMAVRTSAAGYATFYDSGWAFTLPTGLQAQVVNGVSDGKLSYETLKDGVIPKDVAVMLTAEKKQAADYSLTRTESDAVYPGTNLLHGSDEATTTTGDGYHYKLTYGKSGSNLSDVFGWYWGAQNGGAFQIEGHKAWLVVPKSAGARSFSVEGEANSINDLQIDDLRFVSPVYDLQGRRVDQPTKKGIYIKNGKKVIKK